MASWCSGYHIHLTCNETQVQLHGVTSSRSFNAGSKPRKMRGLHQEVYLAPSQAWAFIHFDKPLRNKGAAECTFSSYNRKNVSHAFYIKEGRRKKEKPRWVLILPAFSLLVRSLCFTLSVFRCLSLCSCLSSYSNWLRQMSTIPESGFPGGFFLLKGNVSFALESSACS